MAEITVDSNTTLYPTLLAAVAAASNEYESTIFISGEYSNSSDRISANGTSSITNKDLTFKGKNGRSTDIVSVIDVRTQKDITFEDLTLSLSEQIKFTYSQVLKVNNADVSCAGNFSHVGNSGSGRIDLLNGARLSIASFSNDGLRSDINLSNSKLLIGTMTNDKQLLFGKSNLTITSDLYSTIRSGGNVQNKSGVSGSVINIIVTDDDLDFLSTSGKKTYQLLQVTRADCTVSSDVALKINNEAPAALYRGYTYTTLGDHGMYLTKQNTNTVYIGSSPEYGYYGEIIDEGTENEKLVGLNAGKTTSVVASDTTNIYFEAGNSDSYGNLNLSTLDIENDATLHAGAGTVTLGALTTKTGKKLTVTSTTDGAATLTTGAITNNSIISIEGNATLSATGSVTNSGTITIGNNSNFSSSSSITNNGGTIVFKYVVGAPADQKIQAASINNSNGIISIDLTDYDEGNGTIQITDFAVTNGTIRQAASPAKTASFFRDANNYIWVTNTATSTIYVNTVWPQKPDSSEEYTVGEHITDDIIWGINSTNILKDGTASDAISQVTSGKFENVCIYNVGDASGYDFRSTGITGIGKDVAITAQNTDTSIVIKQLGVTKNTEATVTFKDISLTAGSETFRAYGVDSKPGGAGDDYFSSKIAFDRASYTGPGNGSSDPYKIIAEKYAAIELTKSTLQDTKIQSMGGTVSVSGSNIKDSTISTTNNNGSRLSLTGTEIAPSTFDNSNLSLTKDTTVDFSGDVELKNGSAMTVGSGITVNATNTGTLTVKNSSIAATSMDNTGGKITIADDSTLNVGGDGEGEALNGGVIDGSGNLTLGAKNKLNNVSLSITGTLTNNGAITVSASQYPLTANGINNSAGTITVNAAGVVVTGGMRKVIDLGSGSALVANLSISGNDDVAFFYDGEDYWLIDKDASRATLYVNSAWSGYAYGEAIEGETGLYYGYNAFSTFLDVSSPSEKKGALSTARDAGEDVTIQIVNMETAETLPDDLFYTFNNNLTISGSAVKLSDGNGYYDLCLTPAEGRTITINTDFVCSGSAGMWPNYNSVSPNGTVTINSTISARKVGFKDTAEIGQNATINAANFVVKGTSTDEDVVSVTGKASHTGTNYQIDAVGNKDTGLLGAILLMGGKLNTTGTNIRGTYLTYEDDNWGFLQKDFILNSDSTTWTVVKDLKVIFYQDPVEGKSGVFNFTNGSVLNVKGDVVNVPKRTTTGQDSGVVLASGAITLNLDHSTMTVGTYDGDGNRLSGGEIINKGTITMDNHSILIANSYENYGTINISGSEARAYDSFDNYGVVTVSDGALFTVNGEFTQGGSNDSKYLAVTNATFYAGTLKYQGGSISVNGSSFTVSSTSNAAEINKALTITSTSETVAEVTTWTSSTVSFNEILFGGSGSISMDWRSTLSFTGFGSKYTNKFTIGADGFVSATDVIKKKVLDYKGNAENKPTEDYYKELLTGWDTDNYKFIVDNDGDLWIQQTYPIANVTIGGNDSTATPTHPDFITVNGATSVKPNKIVIKDGTYSTASVLNAIPAVIKDGTFQKSVTGGLLVNEGSSGDLKEKNGTISLEIGKIEDGVLVNPGGEFTNLVTGSDRVVTGIFKRYAPKDSSDNYTTAVNLTINGGIFKSDVACGMVYMGANSESHAYIYGDTNLVINGGSFAKFVYGGSTANNNGNSGSTHIFGNTSITVNATNADNKVSLNKLVAGSYQTGEITGDTHVTLTGNGANLIFAEGGEIWGGCTSDYYSISSDYTRTYKHIGTKQGKNRILTFEGFSGALNCTKIRAFNQAEFTDSTNVTLDNGGVYNFSDIEQWTFECGSKITAGNFANSFVGDTLILTGVANFDSLAEEVEVQNETRKELTIMENSRGTSAFAGFGGNDGDMTVKFYLNADDTTGTSMAWETDGYYGGDYKLALDSTSTTTKMIFSHIG